MFPHYMFAMKRKIASLLLFKGQIIEMNSKL